jgi:hypothetical protein
LYTQNQLFQALLKLSKPELIPMAKEYIIGRHQLLLPDDHQLDPYQARWHRYDTALEDVLKVP